MTATGLIFLLLLIAAVLFALAAFGVDSGKRNLMAAGLCLVAVALNVPHANALLN